MELKNIFLHFKKICIHKYWVGYYCFKAGLYWQGITHDLSKFSPVEFWESVKYYQGTSSPIDAAKKSKGYSKAWFHHRSRNPHHHVYWLDDFDEGGYAIMMPEKYVAEMFCDFLGAGRAYWGDKFTPQDELAWWNKKKVTMAAHPQTKEFINEMFRAYVRHGEQVINKSYMSAVYAHSLDKIGVMQKQKIIGK